MNDSRGPVVVLAGGPLGSVEPGDLPQGAYVIAADSGWRHATELQLTVDLLVGDLDSIGDSQLVLLERDGLQIERVSSHKDETDLELALARAKPIASEIVVLGALGGRFDHTLGNFAAACSPALKGIPTKIIGESESIQVVRGHIRMNGNPGDLVSLLPWGGPVRNVTTTGLVYPLNNETLHATQARGISNVFVSTDANVEFKEGTLLVVRPRKGASPA